jgi:N-acetylneuraminic acid mutarotase
MRKLCTLLLIVCFAMSSTPLVRGAEDSWIILEPMPTAETGLGAAVVSGKIYAIGEEVNYEYDPAANTWIPKTPMPTPRAGFGIAVYLGRIYVIGGGYGVYPNRTVTGVNEVYDPATDTWETKSLMPTKRSGMCATVVDGKIYVLGGRTGEQYSTVDLNEVYDPETDTWTTKEPIPYPVVGYASAVVDGKIFVLGGQDEYHDPMNLDLTQIYDSETDMWSQGTPIPTATVAAAAGMTEGTMAPERIYVMGGDGGFFYPLDRNYVYDPQADVWNTGTAIPTPRINPAVAVVNDLVYVIGGTSGPGGLQSTPTAAVEQYTPADYIPEFPTWIVLPLFLVATLFGIIIRKKIRGLEISPIC